MESRKQVIEGIRRIRFGIGLDTSGLTEDAKKALKDKEDILKNAAKLADEIHTKNPHLFFELIQNAEDNEYIDGIKPNLRFIVDSARLIIQNNEKGFEEKNVKALCGIGETTKTNKALGYIGEKGIGFKSVFMVADKVQIYSNGFQFQFNHTKESPLWNKWGHATMLIPEWVDDVPDFVDVKQTNIILYIKPELRDKISEYIEEIHPSLLLFLKKLRVIELYEKDKNKVRKIELYERDGIVEIVYGEKRSFWKVVRKTFKVPDNIREEKREGVKEREIILAFPLKEDFSSDASVQEVFAFLPVRKYGFKFIIQADFLLPITREDIIKDNKWNIWLRDTVGKVFLEALSKFKNDEKLKYSFYDYLSFEEVKDEFFLPLVNQIYESLKKEECILTDTEQWRKPSEVLIGDEKIKELIPNEDLQRFLGKEYMSQKIKAKKSVLNKLGVREFSIDDLIKCLENTEWIKTRENEWFVKLYAYLNYKKLSYTELEKIRSSKIIKLENEELTSIKEGTIFFFLEKKVMYGFENELRVIKKDIMKAIFAQEKEKKEEILKFLKDLGIKRANPYEIIRNHILPIYESGSWEQKDEKILMGYIRYIKDNINNIGYIKVELSEKLHIRRIDKNDEGKRWYDIPKNIYLPKIYGNENDLEELFEGIDVYFVHPCYIKDDLEKFDKEIAELERRLKEKQNEIEDKSHTEKIKEQIKGLKEEKKKKVKEWKNFFKVIGVNDIPRIQYYKGAIFDNDKYPTNEEREYSPAQKEEVEDWRLSKEFKELLNLLEFNKSKNLLKILDRYWNYKYSKYLKMKYQWFRYSWKDKPLSSSFIRDLREKIKVPTTQNTLAKPSEVFWDKPHIREVLGDTAPYLAVEVKNEDFVKALGIKAELNADVVLDYLESLVRRGSENKEAYEGIYRFFNTHLIPDRIKKRFADEPPLIFVPNSEKKYYTTKEVIWKDFSKIFGKNKVYLEKYYSEELKYFFVKRLDVSEEPIPKDYANTLVSISQKKNISDKDKEIIIRIYEELNKNLDPEKVKNPIFWESWWNDFVKKRVFLTTKGKFLSSDRNIFINDDDEIYKLFKDESINFLWLPKNYHLDKIKSFIEHCKLRYLSKSIRVKPMIENTDKYLKDEKLTNLIRNTFPYVLRYLYQEAYKDYERVKDKFEKEVIFQKNGEIEVYLVDNLRVKYFIDDREWLGKEADKKCVYYDGGLYLKKSDDSIYDLAVEFSKIFGEIKGLDDFVMNIMNNISSVEKIMKAKKIPELPLEEKEFWLKLFGGKDGGMEKVESRAKEQEDDTYAEKRIMDVNMVETLEEKQKGVVDMKENLELNNFGIETKEEKWEPEYSPEEVPPNVEIYSKNKKIVKDQKKIYEESKKRHTEAPPQMSNEDSKDIGRWGEKYVYGCIKKELREKYPDTSLLETSKGFKLEREGNVIAEVIWLNKEGESNNHYDIKVIENGREIFVEVKSTTTSEKSWFEVSKWQWSLIREKGDDFCIYRVYNARTNKARAEKIQNPAKLWLDGFIEAYPIHIEL